MKIKNLIITYEGHAFENIIFEYANEKKKKSFGYFFVIREFKNSILQFRKSYRPSTIFTSGTIVSKYLKKNIKFNSKNIFTLGSDKHFIKKIKIRKNYKEIKVLFAEGLYSKL